MKYQVKVNHYGEDGEVWDTTSRNQVFDFLRDQIADAAQDVVDEGGDPLGDMFSVLEELNDLERSLHREQIRGFEPPIGAEIEFPNGISITIEMML